MGTSTEATLIAWIDLHVACLLEKHANCKHNHKDTHATTLDFLNILLLSNTYKKLELWF